MGFFGTNKSAQEPATPLPTQADAPPPQQTPPTPPATEPQASEQPPATAPVKTGIEDTKSWQDLIDENAQPAETPSAAQEPQPPATPATSAPLPTAEPVQNTKPSLPKEIQDIIENAGDKARKTLFKNSEDSDATE